VETTRQEVPASGVRVITANGITLSYETYGSSADEPLLMIMGLGTQLPDWDRRFCDDLVRQGFFVIRFDNRDCGLSQRFDGVPDMAAIRRGDRTSLTYTLDDMAEDAVGLLDALEIDRAHIVGASLGGMIAQIVAIRRPDRVRSLCSLMSSTGDPAVGRADPVVMELIRRPVPDTRQDVIDAAVERSRTLAGTGFAFDEAAARLRAASAYDRAHYPAGRLRHQAAAVAAGDRTAALSHLSVPTVVVHGSDDRLVDISGGKATADAIRGASLEVIDGMGHGIPVGAWPQIMRAVVRNARRARDRPARLPS